MSEFEILGRPISSQRSPYIVAELSANHGGDINNALRMIEMCKEHGADAIKIQTYTPDTMTLNCNSKDFIISSGLWKGYNLYDLYKDAYTPFEWHKTLFEYSKEIGITLFSTPFDETAVELLQSLDAPAYKIASFELTDAPLLKLVAQTGKPVILSTGLASHSEISEALDHLESNGAKHICVLHCISAYPAPLDQANVTTILDIKKHWPQVQVGLSDHTLSHHAAIAATALGAAFIEKHVTPSRDIPSPDSSFSIEPNELQYLVEETHKVWSSLGTPSFDLKQAEQENKKFRRSIYISKDVKKGEILSQDNIRRVRPGFGLEPKYFEQVMGKKFSQNLSAGTALTWELFND